MSAIFTTALEENGYVGRQKQGKDMSPGFFFVATTQALVE